MDNKELNDKVESLKAKGFEPPLWCSFACSESDEGNAQHAACLAVNGVHCRVLEEIMEKGAPCRLRRWIKKAASGK